MRVLLTGATGFIGQTLTPLLVDAGHDVYGLVRYVSGGRYSFYDNDRVLMADLRDEHAVITGIRQIKPDVILHLAAMSAVSYSFQNPREVKEVIEQGTAAVAEGARQTGAWLIHASSSEVYGRHQSEYDLPLRETYPLGGTSPYGSAKVNAEEYLTMLRRAYGMPITIARPFNTIGRAPLKNQHFVVERAITQALETGHIRLHDPKPKRDFLFRTDHAAAYLAILAKPRATVGETFNVCTGDCWSIQQMAEEVRRIVQARSGRPVDVAFSAVPDRPFDIDVLWGSAEKLRAATGWTPQYTIAGAIQQAVVEWEAVLAQPEAA